MEEPEVNVDEGHYDSIIEIHASNEVCKEVAYAVLGRGMDLHENSIPDNEEEALALKEIFDQLSDEMDEPL